MGAKAGKRYADALSAYDRDAQHEVSQAIDLLKRFATAKFDESVELSVRLGIDSRKSDQIVRGTVSLPSGGGGDVRVAVFAKGDDAQAATSAGADVVGAEDLAERITGGFLDFDIVISTPELMGEVGKLGKVLGPRGLMPNPKSGTVASDVSAAVTEFKSGKVEYRADRYGNVALAIGKAAFSGPELEANLIAVMEEIERARPASTKGRYVKKITVSSTMGPGIKIDPAFLAA